MTTVVVLFVTLGLLLGYIYFMAFEKFDVQSMPEKCWTILHNMNKQNSPMYMVHLKSMLAGLLIIVSAMYKWTSLLIFLGSAIIGLHIGQVLNELHVIRTQAERVRREMT